MSKKYERQEMAQSFLVSLLGLAATGYTIWKDNKEKQKEEEKRVRILEVMGTSEDPREWLAAVSADATRKVMYERMWSVLSLKVNGGYYQAASTCPQGLYLMDWNGDIEFMKWSRVHSISTQFSV